ncbi:hypothetical protein OS128_05195 [Corynebacterium sp. P5848]|uniref:VG15 protein n=1 Tax=Corynebacterium marambiense TaxID=2765364 RepID=UPI0022608B4B|nr:hypothetical protein [Corynebacterium marambiense]MCX7542306.1 hypothetical protein [Corynebacterium marambiense]
MPPVARWRQLQAQQRQIGILAMEDLLDVATGPVTPEQLGQLYQVVVDRYGSVAAHLAVEALEDARKTAGQIDLPDPVLSDPLPAAQIEGTYSWASATAASRDPEDIARKLAGPLGRLIQQRARETIWDSTAAAGTRYARLPGPKACAFCLMLASRGAVYTAETVLTTGMSKRGRRGRRPEGLTYHDHCDCVAVESYAADDLPKLNRDLQDEWIEATWENGKPGNAQWQKWQAYIAETRPNKESAKPDTD